MIKNFSACSASHVAASAALLPSLDLFSAWLLAAHAEAAAGAEQAAAMSRLSWCARRAHVACAARGHDALALGES